ncbi:MAG: hypothetical protein JNM84_21965 [Planctomycetes bacterium]|nr:hypothetical protein [Planctomycetota bacterium]
MKKLLLGAGSLALTLAVPATAQLLHWPTTSGGNGHYYQAVLEPSGISWTQARAAAQARGGYLATPTSGAENTFVFQLVDDPQYWVQSGNSNIGPWLGGYQTFDNGSTPHANWAWVTGEPWSFTSWAPGEPNNFAGLIEDYLGYKCSGPSNCRSSSWNDAQVGDNPTSFGIKGYVVEYDTPPPAASCTVRNGNGVNPLDCVCATLPVVGTTWQIGTSPNANTAFTAVLLSLQPASTPLPLLGGELLIDLGFHFQLPGNGVHTMPVPPDSSWLGFRVVVQGVRLDAVGGPLQVVLLNALDAVVGI